VEGLLAARSGLKIPSVTALTRRATSPISSGRRQKIRHPRAWPEDRCRPRRRPHPSLRFPGAGRGPGKFAAGPSDFL